MPRPWSFLCMAPLFAGCGAMMARGPFPVWVESSPPGATVYYQDRPVGVTPCRVDVERTARTFELVRPGYHRQRIDPGVVGNPWVAGNVFTLGLGMVVDVAWGTDRIPDPEPMLVFLGPATGPERPTWVRAEVEPEPTTPAITRTGRLVGAILLAAARSEERLPPASDEVACAPGAR